MLPNLPWKFRNNFSRRKKDKRPAIRENPTGILFKRFSRDEASGEGDIMEKEWG
jgi:hypothetical protein